MAISYLSGGKIGDFIQQLSIVYEKYLKTNQKAILYISNKGDEFRFGLDKAYKDLSSILALQPYIELFKIHNNEPYDVDLTSWRQCDPNGSFIGRVYKEYSVYWGVHKWIFNIPVEKKWNRFIVINTTHYRFPDNIDWNALQCEYGRNHMIFVSFEELEYKYFVKSCFQIGYYKPTSLYELYIILNSCKLFVGSLSAPLSITLSLHSPSTIGYVGSKQNYMDYLIFKSIKTYIRRAYILTTDLNSERSQFCRQLLSDIGFETVLVEATPHENKILSNRISMTEIYKKIYSSTDAEWSYVFEDDINILDKVEMKELMAYEDISSKFFYLGCCGPNNVVKTEHEINNQPVYKINGGYVKGLHAVAFSKQGICEFLQLINREEDQSCPMDVILEKFAQAIKPNIVRYDLESYIKGHQGLFFQDRIRFPTSITN